MKVTSGAMGSHFGVGLLRTTALVALALGVTLALLFAAGPVEAGEGDGFLVPIVLEEGRTPPPDVADPPSTPEPPQVRTVVDPPDERVQRQVQGNSDVGITQTSTTLISNTGKAVTATDFVFTTDLAQAFTTGSDSSGYTLTSVELNLRSTGTEATYSVAIHEDSSGEPAATSLGTLTTTTTLSSTFSLVQFDASGSGISLTASTTYWVVVDVSTSSNTTAFRRTTSNDEDSGGATGWSIANSHLWRNSSLSNWGTASTDTNPIHIRVNGSAKTPTQASVVLVANNGTVDAGTLGFNRDRGQPFTTGSNAAGYKLTKVQIASNTTLATVGNYSVSIASAGSSGPGSTLTGGGLNEPAGLTQGIANDFTASGDGIDLDPNKTYYILIDLTAQNSNVFWKSTASNDENANPAAGWSVGNASYSRMVGSTTTTWTQLSSNKMKIKVFGYAKAATPPVPQSAQIVHTPQINNVQITFDKNLDTTSVPHISRFQARFTFGTVSASGITISGNKVNVRFGVSLGTNSLVWIQYQKPTSDPLKGTDGAEVAGFKFPEQTSTPTPTPPVFRPPPADDDRVVSPGPWITPKPNRADLSGTNVVVSMDKAVLLDANYSTAQLAAKFTVWVNGDRRAIEGASVSGYRVRLDLGSSFSAPAGARVAVNYAPGPLLDAAAPENRVGGFSLSPGPWVTPRPNRVDSTATGVVVSMDRPVQLDSNYSASQLAGAFTVRVNGTAYKPTGATVSGRDIRLQIGHPVADGDKLDVDYRKGPLLDSTGMRVGGFNYYGVGK